jgi:hypothetical protein
MQGHLPFAERIPDESHGFSTEIPKGGGRIFMVGHLGTLLESGGYSVPKL